VHALNCGKTDEISRKYGDVRPVLQKMLPSPTPDVALAEDRLRVVVADDDPLVRRILRHTLQDDGMTVVAEATNGREALELASHYRPDILLVDLVMPEGGALEVLDRMRELGVPGVHVIVLTSFGRDEDAVAALRAGAVGWLSKEIGMQELPRALRAAANGEAVVSRRFARVLVEQLRESPEARIGVRPVHSPLSEREWEVLDALCGHSSTIEIASTLELSPETVRTHVKSILRKLGVRTREEAVAAAPRLRTPG
jgi:DNA-binding NarL/FixJ family response regulator